METGTVVMWGAGTALVWLYAVNFDRIQRRPQPWDRWFRRPAHMLPVMKGLAFGTAIAFTVVFGMMLVTAVTGRPDAAS